MPRAARNANRGAFLANMGQAIDALKRADASLASLPSPSKRRITPTTAAIGAHRYFLKSAQSEIALCLSIVSRVAVRLARQP